MNPGSSRVVTGRLPSAATNAVAVATVSALVRTERTTSTSAIIGTGLKKCRPTRRPGCWSPAA